MPRRSCLLCQAFDSDGREDGQASVAERCWYIVFKDRNIVPFYTNNLAKTRNKTISKTDDHAMKCVQGLTTSHQYVGNEFIYRTEFSVLPIIVAYKLFMNEMDRFDNVWFTTPATRKEKSLPTSILTFLLVASVIIFSIPWRFYLIHLPYRCKSSKNESVISLHVLTSRKVVFIPHRVEEYSPLNTLNRYRVVRHICWLWTKVENRMYFICVKQFGNWRKKNI